MRALLILIAALFVAAFATTFLGQANAFYKWHNGAMELRGQNMPTNADAALAFESRLGRLYPRWQEWMAIRVFSGIGFGATILGLYLDRQRGRSQII